MKNFKTKAEEWAEKELKKHPFNQDFLEYMMFGSIGYHIDKEGNRRKLTQQELWDLKNNPNVISTDIDTNTIIKIFGEKQIKTDETRH